MHVLNYIIWNGSPEVVTIGPLTLRWYGMLFALGFLISQQILYYMFKQEGKPTRDVDTLTIYMVVATIVGARLGHIFFYQPEILWTDPLGVFLPFEFSPEFRFTGLQGLASHGAAIGILIGLWLYSRKNKPGQNYLQTLDRIVILVALTGALIRFGNFFNSEILGTPTTSPTGIVFINRVTQALSGDSVDPNNIVEKITVQPNPNGEQFDDGRVPIKIMILFKPGISEQRAQIYMRSNVKNTLYYLSEFVSEPMDGALNYNTIKDEATNQVYGHALTQGIARHPAQLYEAITCVLLAIFLFSIWVRYKANLPEGRIFGYFMVILWSLRFAYEFLKINQVSFEDSLPINMGQILSIPLILVGVVVLIRSYRTKPTVNA
ncbi:MAG: prolipoprotein diacylglyceryl transferase [Cyclobacteriaceae bacterium]|nr:prolipoprotein diacylglyceryl transferase [Cytophagales bacterium]HNP77995.1 prolipoprotein diacylglyceryl transferase [Cyclobacteriaceae bacterium]